MNASLPPSYTNAASAESLRSLDAPCFTDEQLARFSDQALAVVRQQQAFMEAHPARAIYRLATEGSQNRDGGIVQQATSALEYTLESGRKVRVAQIGDVVVYADGRTAQIVTGAGTENSDIALVGSRLCNGDEIINTLQSGVLLVGREGVPMAEDFLPPVQQEEHQ
ncbi:hypothetical protein [Pseudomonas vancouverensis]|uniref:PAAR domain-containing protein n=1 Tax=Pseudomonas vancouverensis TaxID=95300 RepID=A0A4R4JXU4_PSEVA|nr:hypothetical protein [Pseudomonas vancouverensis]KAB0491098.1 hypothetical protein F7R09_25685 [Pseudomonas vancouverensis]TDB59690.1 hypothetical protein EIY72_18975 [Pseudomonas vancouverensis]